LPQVLTLKFVHKRYFSAPEYANHVTRDHYEALLKVKARAGSPAEVQAVIDAMTEAGYKANEQSYTYLFHSLWKVGTPINLAGVVCSMHAAGLRPSSEMIDFTIKALKAGKGEDFIPVIETFKTEEPVNREDLTKVIRQLADGYTSLFI
jgi:hypothetical protein